MCVWNPKRNLSSLSLQHVCNADAFSLGHRLCSQVDSPSQKNGKWEKTIGLRPRGLRKVWEKPENLMREWQPRPIVSWDSQDSLRPCGQSLNLQWEQTQTWRLRISRVDKNFCLWTLQWVDMEALNCNDTSWNNCDMEPPWWRSCFSIVYHVNAS